ncbi:MAG: hypothetical protein NC099_01075 [Corallococcus sp.]|nr:hypothetical protein [Bacillota bacterium]MCM1533226.1 hypothetical protein [Corallococcus sp.]
MEILTSQALWENYSPTEEQLDVNVFKSTEKDGLVTKQLYFTGRTVDANAKTRVFATVCYKNTRSVKQAVLLIGDYKKPVNVKDVEELAKQGFVAMAIDFAGRCGKGMYTVYTDALDYCNADVAPDMFYFTTSARETKLFEYALNCRRAITYLFTEEKIKGVSVVTVGKGAYVGIIVMGVDKRLTNGAVLFGSLTRKFPESEEQEEVDTSDAEMLNRHLEYDIWRQAWTMGLAPQTYAMQAEIPIYVINSANSARVDAVKADKMVGRLNNRCRFLLLPNTFDYISDKYFDGLVRWIKGAQVPAQKALTASLDENGEYYIKVQTSSSINKVSVWYCTNVKKRAKFWRQAKVYRDGEYYAAKLDLYDKENEIMAFALFDREVAVSTPLFTDTVTVARPKIANKNIFSGTTQQRLIRLDSGGAHLNLPLEQQLTEGYLGIVGAQGKAMGTFAISDESICRNSSLTLGFDVCCNVKQQLTVTALCDFGGGNVEFKQSVDLVGDGKWQRVTVERDYFRRAEDGKQISEGDVIDMIIISADSDIIVNNVFLV